MKTGVKLCSNCVRNIKSNYIKSDGEECIYCQAFNKNKKNLENRLEKIKGTFLVDLNRKRGKGYYDCIVMVSGGKDSITALYKISKNTDLRVLAYTIENGFEPIEAIANIKKVVEKLGIDWIYDRPRYMVKVIRAVLKEKIKISLCRFCATAMVNRAIKTAAVYKIPTIVTGWNKGQSDKEPSRFPLWNLSDTEVDKLIKKYPFMKDIGLHENENRKLLEKLNIRVISPWIYEARDSNLNIRLLQKKLGWEVTKISYPYGSTSCYLNLLQVVLSRKYFGYSHYDCEESMLINYGEKTRKEAIQALNHKINKAKIIEILKDLDLSLKDIGLTVKELNQYINFLY